MMNIENCSSHFDNNISHLTILSQAKNNVKTNYNNLLEDNLLKFAEEFLTALTFSDNDRMTINQATMGQHNNKSWHEMRHLSVTGKKMKSIYTQQKTLEKVLILMYHSLLKISLNKKNLKKTKCIPKP